MNEWMNEWLQEVLGTPNNRDLEFISNAKESIQSQMNGWEANQKISNLGAGAPIEGGGV